MNSLDLSADEPARQFCVVVEGSPTMFGVRCVSTALDLGVFDLATIQ
ncbi:MAG: hypothetical protein NT013_15660 [Planctomycetia bacterium]|nr:hypothetical protein [Planctomycetia bacterium]